jgi:hypothetical protein
MSLIHLGTRIAGTVPLRSACGLELRLHSVSTSGLRKYVQCERCLNALDRKPRCWPIEDYHYERENGGKQ